MATWTNITTANYSSGSVSLGGSYTLYYQKIDINGAGVLTFQGTSSSSYGQIANDSTTKNRLAIELGVTVSSWYDGATNPYNGTVIYNGSSWTSLSIRNQTIIYGVRYSAMS